MHTPNAPTLTLSTKPFALLLNQSMDGTRRRSAVCGKFLSEIVSCAIYWPVTTACFFQILKAIQTSASTVSLKMWERLPGLYLRPMTGLVGFTVGATQQRLATLRTES